MRYAFWNSKVVACLAVFLQFGPAAMALQISEIMYHPRVDEFRYEFLEIYNETVARRDLDGWRLAGGIRYSFPPGTLLEPGECLVVALEPSTIRTVYGIDRVYGPFLGRLGNGSERIELVDPAGGVITAVEYEDDDGWPVAVDGAGPSLTKAVMRGDPMNPANWRLSSVFGGTPGRLDDLDEIELIAVGDDWLYWKGREEPPALWREREFDDSDWAAGPTGIGYGDGDDATVLGDMRGNYISVYCRRGFAVTDPSAIRYLVLEVDHDDGFVAYLNGVEVGRAAMPAGAVAFDTPGIDHEASGGNPFREPPTVIDISHFKHLLDAGENTLAVEVHNGTILSSDLSFIPRLLDRSLPPDFPVVINELKCDPPGEQYVELYNSSTWPADISGFSLSNQPENLQRFTIPLGTLIPPKGRVAFLSSELGFWINPDDDPVLLTRPSGMAVVDGHKLDSGPFGLSVGRWPDGGGQWFAMPPTTGTANATELTTAVVINEIMYHPLRGEAGEYLELHNIGHAAVRLDGWRLSGGLDYEFPFPTTLDAGDFLVIARHPNTLIERYGLDPVGVLGPYAGRLSDSGETLRLRDLNGNVVDHVRYYEGGQWSEDADGYGPSLEVIDPRHDNGSGQNWAASEETGKSEWTYFSYEGLYRPSATRPAPPKQDEFHLHLMGAGELLIDDVRLTSGGVEYIPNGGFEEGIGDWLAIGNHAGSRVTSETAHSGSRCLRVLATGHGDTGANHIEIDAATTMTEGTYALSFWAKWVRGNRVLVTRCFNNQMPDTHMLPVPPRPGTPGAPNSAYRPNLGPIFSEIQHRPVVPNASQSVAVTARLYDPDGVTSVVLHYRADSDSATSQIQMYDDGLRDDGEAGDGLFAGEIPPRGTAQTVAFALSARDGRGAERSWPAKPNRPALYRIEASPVQSDMQTYRIIMTKADETELWNRPHLSNEPLNCTFIFNERDVYHNCAVRYTGSPWHRRDQDAAYRGYKVSFNADEKLHGVKSIARINKTAESGRQTVRMAYDVLRRMGLPACPVELLRLRVNSLALGYMEDVVPPGRQYLSMFYPDNDDGLLFEVGDRLAYFNENDLNFHDLDYFNGDFAWRVKGFESMAGDKDVYRHNYQARNQENDDDYTSLVLLLDRLNNTPDASYESVVDGYVNVEQWLRLLAVRATLSDWDSMGAYRGKNAYLYWNPEDVQWDLLAWDLDAAFSQPRLWVWSAFPALRRLEQHGNHRHLFYSYVMETLDKQLNHAALDPWIDYYADLYGQPEKAEQFKTFIDERRAYFFNPESVGYIPTTAITIAGSDSQPIVVQDAPLTLHGTAPVEVRILRINGVEFALDWTDATNWFLSLPLAPGEHWLYLEFLDYNGNVVGVHVLQVRVEQPSRARHWDEY